MMDAQKLNIFPSTLKGMALRWFMGLGGKSITDCMRTAFLEKYQDYCKSGNIKMQAVGMKQYLYHREIRGELPKLLKFQ